VVSPGSSRTTCVARCSGSTIGFAYTAWHFTPLHPELMGDGTTGPPVEDRPRRLRLLADIYGLSADERAGLLGEVAAIEIRQTARVADGALANDEVYVRLWGDGRFTENIGRSLNWLAEYRSILERALA
jgi:hypothetical protein